MQKLLDQREIELSQLRSRLDNPAPPRTGPRPPRSPAAAALALRTADRRRVLATPARTGATSVSELTEMDLAGTVAAVRATPRAPMMGVAATPAPMVSGRVRAAEEQAAFAMPAPVARGVCLMAVVNKEEAGRSMLTVMGTGQIHALCRASC
jgi:hypothetical protein